MHVQTHKTEVFSLYKMYCSSSDCSVLLLLFGGSTAAYPLIKMIPFIGGSIERTAAEKCSRCSGEIFNVTWFILSQNKSRFLRLLWIKWPIYLKKSGSEDRLHPVSLYFQRSFCNKFEEMFRFHLNTELVHVKPDRYMFYLMERKHIIIITQSWWKINVSSDVFRYFPKQKSFYCLGINDAQLCLGTVTRTWKQANDHRQDVSFLSHHKRIFDRPLRS